VEFDATGRLKLDPHSFGAGVTITNNQYVVDQNFAPTWTGIHTFNAGAIFGADTVFNAVMTVNAGMDFEYTPVSDHEIALHMHVHASGFGDTHAMHVLYDTGAMAALSEANVWEVEVDPTAAAGGTINALAVSSLTLGSLSALNALKTGPGVSVIHQETGTFVTSDKAWKFNSNSSVYTDITATPSSIFDHNGDIVYVGHAASTYRSIAFVLTTGANTSVLPTFQYWNGAAWTTFVPVDGTNGFIHSGLVEFSPSALTGWTPTSVNGSSQYWIRITRTKPSILTLPVQSSIQINTGTTYFWNASGDLTVNAVTIKAFGAGFVQSDSAGVLSSNFSSSPTWTGAHTFAGSGGIPVATSVTINGGNAGQILQSNFSAAAGSRNWDSFVTSGGVLTARALDDAVSVTKTWLAVARSGATISSLSFGNAADNPTYSFLGTGLTTFNGNVLITQASFPELRMQYSGAAANEKNWVTFLGATYFALSTAADATPGSEVSRFLTATRSGSALASMEFGNATDNPTSLFSGTGTKTFSGQVLASFANPDVSGFWLNASTGTNAAAMKFSNTGGNLFVGLDSSTGLRISGIGADAYAGAVWHDGNHPLVFGANNTLVATMAPGGNFSPVGVILGPAGAVGAPTYSFAGDPNTGLYSAGADQLAVSTAGTLRFVFENDGRIYGTALHNTGTVTGTTNQYIASGTYTPTLTNVTNIAASTARQGQWTRVGNVVTVSGQVDIDPTAAGAIELGISLPIASTFTTAFQLGGTGAPPLLVDRPLAIDADTVNARARARCVSGDTSNHTFTYIFSYEVL